MTTKVSTKSTSKTSKSKTTSKSVAPKTTTKSSTSKTTVSATNTQKIPENVQNATIVDESLESSTTNTVSDLYNNLIKEVTGLRSQCTSIIAKIRNLKIQTEREKKQAVKDVKKRKMSNRAPSGFLKPTAISDELAAFVGKPKGSEMARREVTLFLNQYIRDHNLQNPNNGRIILADEKLRKLLKLDPSTELTYFNLQTHMTSLFPKKETSTSS